MAGKENQATHQREERLKTAIKIEGLSLKWFATLVVSADLAAIIIAFGLYYYIQIHPSWLLSFFFQMLVSVGTSIAA